MIQSSWWSISGIILGIVKEILCTPSHVSRFCERWTVLRLAMGLVNWLVTGLLPMKNTKLFVSELIPWPIYAPKHRVSHICWQIHMQCMVEIWVRNGMLMEKVKKLRCPKMDGLTLNYIYIYTVYYINYIIWIIYIYIYIDNIKNHPNPLYHGFHFWQSQQAYNQL